MTAASAHRGSAPRGRETDTVHRHHVSEVPGALGRRHPGRLHGEGDTRASEDQIREFMGGRGAWREEEEEKRGGPYVPSRQIHTRSQNSRLIQICILGWRIWTGRWA